VINYVGATDWLSMGGQKLRDLEFIRL